MAAMTSHANTLFNGINFVRMHVIAAIKRSKIPKNFAVI